jgi:hypothetical protein
MAKRFSKSILHGLDRLRKVFRRTPEKPSASKKIKRTEPHSSPSGADPISAATGAAEASEAKPDKKKVTAQPWFRHRQRW